MAQRLCTAFRDVPDDLFPLLLELERALLEGSVLVAGTDAGEGHRSLAIAELCSVLTAVHELLGAYGVILAWAEQGQSPLADNVL